MLKEILKDKIQTIKNVKDWREAIKISANPLLKSQSITENYIDSMIKNVEQFGEYILVADNVALPHSRPENGVNENCLSLLKIDEGVAFDNGEKAYLFFTLGAKDSDQHINTLKELMEIIDDEDKVQSIIDAKSIEEIYSLI